MFGGELASTDRIEFKDLSKLDIVGIFPELHRGAGGLARARRRRTVDNAQMRYFVVHIHRLMEPDAEQISLEPLCARAVGGPHAKPRGHDRRDRRFNAPT